MIEPGHLGYFRIPEESGPLLQNSSSVLLCSYAIARIGWEHLEYFKASTMTCAQKETAGMSG